MSYVLACTIDDVVHCVYPDVDNNKFSLIPVKVDSDLSKAFCHPHLSGAQDILNWIRDNDPDLFNKGLSVQPEAKYR
jgi:hypothetical protein